MPGSSIQRQPLWQATEAKKDWASPRLSGEYWRRYRGKGKVSPIEVAIWVVGLLAFELPKPNLEMQLTVIGGAIGLRLLFLPIVHLIRWRCPYCSRLFSRKHQVGRCEHCGTIFPK